jgi:ribosomal-protein-alanine N-acetyltransferase
MGKKLFRMKLRGSLPLREPPAEVRVVSYSPEKHHEAIRHIYAEAFEDEPWPADWDDVEEFDPQGVFVAIHEPTGSPVGYTISFRRGDSGYVSVVAVLPEFRRRGIASAMVSAAVAYLRSVGLQDILVDAFVTSTPAVETYRSLGFRVVKEFEGKVS